MKRLFVLFFLFLAVCLTFPSFCETSAKKTVKVGIVTDMGKIDDKTFNEYAYKGMMKAAEEFGLKTSFIETRQPTDYVKNIGHFISEGFDVVVTVGFMLGDATRFMAQKHPDVKFIIVDFAYDPPIQNVIGLVFSESQSGFLAGALAGLMTKSHIAGIIAGKEIPPVVRFRNAYEAGVKYVCSDCEVLAVYIDSFNDPARGKFAAVSQVDEGADVIFGAGGATGSGAILGASAAGAWVIGVDQDEYETTFKGGKAPGSEKVLSSATKRIDIAVYEALKMAVKGKFQGGTMFFDAKNGGIGLAPFHDADSAIPSSVKKRLAEIRRKLESAEIDPESMSLHF